MTTPVLTSARFARYIDPTDEPVSGRDGCQWDDVLHIDDMRPVVVVVHKEYGADIGRMCQVHFDAVLEGRAKLAWAAK